MEPQERNADEPDGRAGEPVEPERPSEARVSFSRRWFLALFGGSIAAVVGLFKLARELGGPVSGSRGGGSHFRVLDDFPVRTVDRAPQVPLADWAITVDGMVRRPLTIDYAIWKSLPRRDETVDFHCVEGWSVENVRWGGVRPADILALAEPLPEARYANFHAFDGAYFDSLPLERLRDPATLLADTLDGKPLVADHGGPVRLVVPTQLAYKSVKFVKRIELTDRQQRGYWEQRGYSVDAPVSPD